MFPRRRHGSSPGDRSRRPGTFGPCRRRSRPSSVDADRARDDVGGDRVVDPVTPAGRQLCHHRSLRASRGRDRIDRHVEVQAEVAVALRGDRDTRLRRARERRDRAAEVDDGVVGAAVDEDPPEVVVGLRRALRLPLRVVLGAHVVRPGGGHGPVPRCLDANVRVTVWGGPGLYHDIDRIERGNAASTDVRKREGAECSQQHVPDRRKLHGTFSNWSTSQRPSTCLT